MIYPKSPALRGTPLGELYPSTFEPPTLGSRFIHLGNEILAWLAQRVDLIVYKILTLFIGSTDLSPNDFWTKASVESRNLVDSLLKDTLIVDHHIQLLGEGEGLSEDAFHPDYLSWRIPISQLFQHLKSGKGFLDALLLIDYFSWLYPIKHIQMLAGMAALGISPMDKNPDRIPRLFLKNMTENFSCKPHQFFSCLHAFAMPHSNNNEVLPHKMQFHVSNRHLGKVVVKSEQFIPVFSVHPSNTSAFEELKDDEVSFKVWREKVVADEIQDKAPKMIFWDLKAMNIHPDQAIHDEFYEYLAKYGFSLMVRGDPLLMRRGIENGVHLIVSECAGEHFDKFRQLATQYPGKVFGDLSCCILNAHMANFKKILADKALHSSLLYGSGYPTTAIDIYIRLNSFVSEGLITEREMLCLREIHRYNPLLFSFALCRLCKDPVSGKRLPDSVFEPNPIIAW